jgi:hypothetical protein
MLAGLTPGTFLVDIAMPRMVLGNKFKSTGKVRHEDAVGVGLCANGSPLIEATGQRVGIACEPS